MLYSLVTDWVWVVMWYGVNRGFQDLDGWETSSQNFLDDLETKKPRRHVNSYEIELE